MIGADPTTRNRAGEAMPYCTRCGEDVETTTNHCPRCGALVIGVPTREPERREPVLPPTPVKVDPMPTWDQIARMRLVELVGEITGMETQKTEAENIAKALTAAGLEAPTLPWKAPKVATTTATPRTYPACSRCGTQQTGTAGYSRIDGEAICKRCQAAAAAEAA